MKEIGKTRPYRILAGMKQRCANPANIHYANYGGRGITVCNEWLGRDGAEAFYEWAVTHGYRDDLTIDRIDNALDIVQVTARGCRRRSIIPAIICA